MYNTQYKMNKQTEKAHTMNTRQALGQAITSLTDMAERQIDKADRRAVRSVITQLRNGNAKLLAMKTRHLDTDLRDQVFDILMPLDMVQNGAIVNV